MISSQDIITSNFILIQLQRQNFCHRVSVSGLACRDKKILCYHHLPSPLGIHFGNKLKLKKSI